MVLPNHHSATLLGKCSITGKTINGTGSREKKAILCAASAMLLLRRRGSGDHTGSLATSQLFCRSNLARGACLPRLRTMQQRKSRARDAVCDDLSNSLQSHAGRCQRRRCTTRVGEKRPRRCAGSARNLPLNADVCHGKEKPSPRARHPTRPRRDIPGPTYLVDRSS